MGIYRPRTDGEVICCVNGQSVGEALGDLSFTLDGPAQSVDRVQFDRREHFTVNDPKNSTVGDVLRPCEPPVARRPAAAVWMRQRQAPNRALALPAWRSSGARHRAEVRLYRFGSFESACVFRRCSDRWIETIAQCDW